MHKSTSFISEMTSQLVFGEEVEVLEELERWVYVRQPDGYLGWTFKPYLTEKISPAPTHIVLAPALELRAEADSSAPILSRIFCGTRVKVSGMQDGWAQVQAHVSGWLPLAELRDLSALPQSDLWGGVTGNGIDCSGFARLMYRLCGLELPRDADLQSTEARHIEAPLEPGDLFFFGEGDGGHISHVGVSMGGWKVLHSSRSRNGVYLDDLQENTFLRSIFVHGGTFIGK
ncbi:MAG: NlpC/P60 family protein [Chloroflexi bacterium]|nr:NlpC/P60 family protein [Chloroflexota bacterium]